MTAPSSTTPTGLMSPSLRWTTIGANALIFLGAFETLAVTTIMPTISRDLNGEALYALAFSATLAASIVGTVTGGYLSDRGGPARPLVVAIGIFVLGLLLSGTATSMGVFVAGRFLQGLGSGAINVALFVVVAKLYPPVLHPRIFGVFAAAWVLPSLIGPPFAGVVADTVGWHWVFLGVGVLVVLASGSILPSLRHLLALPVERVDAAGSRWAVPLSIVVAVGALAISLGGAAGDWAWLVALVGLAVVVVALRPLLPRGTLTARAGLPATVLLRGVVAAAFFAVEVYQPYLMTDRYGLPSWLAGLILTVGAVSWAVGSDIQGRLGMRVSHELVVRLGAVFMILGIATQLITAIFFLSPFIAAAGWLVAGMGMGFTYPRISTLVLAHSTPGDQGFNSSAMSIADLAGAASSIAIAGLLFNAFGATAGFGFVAAFALATLIVIIALPVALRVRGVESAEE